MYTYTLIDVGRSDLTPFGSFLVDASYLGWAAFSSTASAMCQRGRAICGMLL